MGERDVSLEVIKKNLLYDTLHYNINEEKQKYYRKKQQKQDELDYFMGVNQRMATELQTQQEQEKEKKVQKRRALALEYQRQIQQKRKAKQQAINVNRSYGQIQQKNQDAFHQRRARQLARIYRKQTSPYETIDSRISRISHTEERSENRIHTEEPENLNYKDYLEREINRRKVKKQEEKQKIKERERFMIEKLTFESKKQQQTEKEYQRRQKISFRTGLDGQIAQKKGQYLG